ncbi:hypothetical protein [Urbifossiella limnaea]|uniref:Uncharacterized protein n=1 Tax=Urbifossiella limnaea TaxID=2528023 RepID=A0A517XSR1_9BACT|nr:hypothetical protein [Urbifossiella limnaea]QDU20522.1 hypothetical protein ETAA1_24740 [Urbifossiella limnaea]
MRFTTLVLPLLAAVAVAQSPQPLPVAAEAPIAKYEPLTVFPTPTQQAVRGVAAGANWLVRMNQAQGRFLHGYRPAVRQVIEGDNELRQAHGARALAQSAKFTGDARSAAVAGQAVLTLLAATKLDPTDPTCRIPTVAGGESFAAVLALAVYELPGADERLLAEAERLCQYLRKQPHLLDPTNPDAGLILSAVMAGNAVRPEPWRAEFVARSMATNRAAYRAARNPYHVSLVIAAYADLHLHARNADAAAVVYELTDWLCGVQYPAANPRNPTWAGGFPSTEVGGGSPCYDTAVCLTALGWAYQVTARNADVTRAERYRQAAQDAALFVTALQYDEPNTRHFENTFRANVLIGGFHLSPSDGDLRVDAAGRCVSGLLRYLASGAER